MNIREIICCYDKPAPDCKLCNMNQHCTQAHSEIIAEVERVVNEMPIILVNVSKEPNKEIFKHAILVDELLRKIKGGTQ